MANTLAKSRSNQKPFQGPSQRTKRNAIVKSDSGKKAGRSNATMRPSIRPRSAK